MKLTSNRVIAEVHPLTAAAVLEATDDKTRVQWVSHTIAIVWNRSPVHNPSAMQRAAAEAVGQFPLPERTDSRL